MRQILLVIAVLPLLGGCVSTAASIVKAPFRVAGKVVDLSTTSRSEADRNYGRKMRKQEEKEGRARRDAAKRCRDNPADCGAYQGYRAGGGN